ncbi:serine hydrolase [Microlunatus lacustris]
MSRPARTRALVVAALAPLVLVACSPAPPRPAPSAPADTPASRSQRALDDLVADPGAPGCTAAVGERGAVVWQGASGLADLESRAPLTGESPVDMGSVAKQFTATALLLLEHAGRLSLDDRLADHLGGLPDWADEVTLRQLVQHTSGVPEYILLLQERSIGLEMESTREEALESLREVEELTFEPGSGWAYSNSNYLLLGLVVEEVAGVPLGEHLQSALFGPLDLAVRPVVGSAGLHSYRRSAAGDAFELADWHWDATGAAGLQATPSTLVRWADTYRTGAPTGPWLNERRTADAAPGAPEGARYGAGVFLLPDGWLAHDGEWAGFNTVFAVTADRQRALAITCLRQDLDPWDTAQQLGADWFGAQR